MSQNSFRNHSPLLVELAGPAGVGKSTLRHVLTERCRAANGSVWGLPVHSLLANGLQLIPAFVPLWRHARSPLWDETRHMVRLRTLQHALRRTPQRSAVIFDEGPVFALAWLRGFGHPTMRSEASEPWWRTTLQAWAQIIHVVVALDAPDTLLAHRIRDRPDEHEVKQTSDPEIVVWMARFRQALDWVLAGLAVEGGPVVLRLETDGASPDRIAAEVLEALDREAYAG